MAEEELYFSPSPHIKSKTTVPWVMRQVFLALLPAAVGSGYFFGFRYVFPSILISILACLGFETLDCLIFKKPLTIYDGSALVTGMLLGLSLPPGSPFWIALVGSGAAIILGKQMFGGLGQNIFNPALVGRAVLLISWPKAMTTWMARPPFALLPGAEGAEVVTTATPLTINQMNGFPFLQELDPQILKHLFLGQVPGSIGETSVLLLLLGFLYLLWRGVVSWHIPLTFFGGLSLVVLLGGESLFFHLLAGGAIMGGCFMATDYVTSPMTRRGQLIFGLGAGAITGIIRLLGNYPEGVTFGILIMNATVPLLDRILPPQFGGEKR
ncbi:MAG: H+/Na+-translocating ferredoxin:NAD+ oxidoreductase subunit [Candidatus Atribacteria bacterium]|nr:H+/Na+-translocating ferredoxin:NAD+ oxidoreductase subunit [Candidatus Atribacteria bacterium]